MGLVLAASVVLRGTDGQGGGGFESYVCQIARLVFVYLVQVLALSSMTYSTLTALLY